MDHQGFALELWILLIFYQTIPTECATRQELCHDVGDRDCILLVKEQKEYADAVQGCITRGGSILNRDTSSDILRHAMTTHDVDRAWIGGTALHGSKWDWYWFHDGLTLTYQGCFSVEGVHSIRTTWVRNGGTAEDCVNTCYQLDRRYAVVSQYQLNELTCRCVNYHLSFAPTPGCRQVCPGLTRDDPYPSCGSDFTAAVYSTTDGASYDAWDESALVDDGRYCGLMVSEWDYLWTDEACGFPYPYICQYDFTVDECRYGNGTSRHWLGSQCISRHYSARSWFGMLQDCARRGGYPVQILTYEQHNALANFLYASGGESFWIGLTKWHWYWEENDRIEHFHFARESPEDVQSRACLLIEEEFDYQWVNVGCERQNAFFCIIDEYTDVPPDRDDRNSKDDDSREESYLFKVAIGTTCAVGFLMIILIVLVVHRTCRRRRTRRISDAQQPNNLDQLPRRRGGSNLDSGGEAYDYIENGDIQNAYAILHNILHKGQRDVVPRTPDAPPLPKSPRPSLLLRRPSAKNINSIAFTKNICYNRDIPKPDNTMTDNVCYNVNNAQAQGRGDSINCNGGDNNAKDAGNPADVSTPVTPSTPTYLQLIGLEVATEPMSTPTYYRHMSV